MKSISDYDFFYGEANEFIIPDSVTTIGEDAFDEYDGLVFYGNKGSYAEEFAKKHNVIFKVIKKE